MKEYYLLKAKIFLIGILLFLLIGFFLPGCMATKTPVGGFTEQKGKEYTYSKSKQLWLCWGTLPLGRTSTHTPANGLCKIIVKQNLIDSFVSVVTGGFIKSQTIKVIAKK